jgi:hypothetical protein
MVCRGKNITKTTRAAKKGEKERKDKEKERKRDKTTEQEQCLL